MLSTAESLLGLSRHLGAYALGPERAALGQLEFAGSVLELAMRLRGSGVSTSRRVAAIALDAGIDRRRLLGDLLPTLEALQLVDLAHGPDGDLYSVTERIPPLNELLALADAILGAAFPEPVERGVLAILNATTVMPITRDSAIEEGTRVASEQDAERALGYLDALQLCSTRQSADGAIVVYNPNVWSSDVEYSNAALRAEDGTVRAALTALIEEVAASAGFPQGAVTSVERNWIDYAVSQGLLLRSLVVTTSGEERAFLFAPHMGRSAFREPTGADPSGHVRQLIGSMVFAKNYAQTRLWAPVRFLEALVRNGEAGDASSIGSDYPMLETSGIVRVEPALRYHKLVLLQSDVAEEAATYLEDAGSGGAQVVGIRDQRRYEPPERERARLARAADTKPAETERLLAALRQEVGQRRYGR